MADINPLVWVDVETTGLDPNVHVLLEVAIVVTDQNLQEIAEPFSVVIRPTFKAFAEMGDVVREMHLNSGLLAELDDGVDLEVARDMVVTYLTNQVFPLGPAPLAGNNVGFDRAFLQAYIPDALPFVHYRNVDVSTVKELARRWAPELLETAPEKTGNHRALGDILDSIAELSHYRNMGLLRNAVHVARKGIVDEPIVRPYADQAPKSTIGGRSHEQQCKVCQVVARIRTPLERRQVETALADLDITVPFIVAEFRDRGVSLSPTSVYRHRAWLRGER